MKISIHKTLKFYEFLIDITMHKMYCILYLPLIFTNKLKQLYNIETFL